MILRGGRNLHAHSDDLVSLKDDDEWSLARSSAIGLAIGYDNRVIKNRDKGGTIPIFHIVTFCMCVIS